MKKVLLLMCILLLGAATVNAQLVYKKVINGTTTSALGRAPQVSNANNKAIYYIQSSEMTGNGISAGTVLKSIGFYYSVYPSEVTGTLKVYLQNTTDTYYLKGSNFNTAIATMTKVSDGVVTVPDASVADFEFQNGTSFTYTGGGLYVAFEWSNTGTVPANITANQNVALSNSAQINGLAALWSSLHATNATGANNTLSSSNWRPNTHFSYELPANDVGITNVYAMNTAPVNEGLQKITARVVNNGLAAHSDLEVTLNVTGANTFTSTKTVAALASEADAIVQFDDFVPTNAGANTITVTINVTDDNAVNNTLSVSQTVGAGRYSHNIGTGDNGGTFGNNAGKALFAARYWANGTVHPAGVRFKVSASTVSADKQRPVKSVLINSSGDIVAESAPYNIEEADYGTWLVLKFTTTNVPITDDAFYAGVVLLGNTDNAPYWPMTAQAEVPGRPFTYYFQSGFDGTVNFAGYSTTRYTIEAFTANAVLNENDAQTSTVYALSKNPLTYGAPETISAIVTNNGETVMQNVPVALNITGSNTFANNKVITKLPAGASLTVTFDGFTATAKGTNTITVTPNANAAKALSVSQEITDGIFSHVVGNTINNNYGSNAGNLIFLAKYHITGSKKIKAVRQTVGSNASNTGKIIFAVLTDAAGNILARSDSYTILDGDRGQVKDFLLHTPTTITDADFMVGVAMDLSNTGFFPAATQTETPLRTGLYFTRTTADAGFTLSAGAGRYMVSAVTEDEVLPVTISTFTAKLNDNKVALNWTVGTETNVNRYEVERSTNGTDFVRVASVFANGSSRYAAVDANPIAGINYYRLKGVDNDGTISEFNELRTVKVTSLNEKELAIYPNPLTGNTINVILTGYAVGTYQYKLADVSGKAVQQGSIVNNGGSRAIVLSGTLAKGIYILQVTNGTEVVQTKVIKQ